MSAELAVVEKPVVTETILPADTKAIEEIASKTVCLRLRVKQLGIRRQAGTNEIETEADKELLHVSKDLIDSKALLPIRRHLGETKSMVINRCLPSVILRGGIYRCPLELVDGTGAMLRARQTELLTEMVPPFVEEYKRPETGLRAVGIRRLGPMGDEAEYPTAEKVANAFGIEWSFFALQTPTSLRQINEALYQQELAKSKAAAQQEADEGKALLRAELAEIVTHLVDRLGVDDEGKPRVFRNNLTERAKNFLAVFPARNVAGDGPMATAAKQVEGLLAGVDPELLRKNESVRAMIAASMGKVKEQLDVMVEEMPIRRIVLAEKV